MHLRRKLLLINLSLVAGLAAMCAALLWGLRGLSGTVDGAVAEYTELRVITRGILHANAARQTLESIGRSGGRPAAVEALLGEAVEQIRLALRDVQDFGDFQAQERGRSDEHQTDEARLESVALTNLQGAIAVLGRDDPASRADEAPAVDPAREQALHLIGAAIAELSDLARKTDVSDASHAATVRVARTITLVTFAATALVIGAAVASFGGYRAIMGPLEGLQSGVRTLASGRFDRRLPAVSDPDFRGLVDDFNRMSAELEDLYRNLDAQVVQKSRELVRSERLASVGFLAAGVAHEINNPLGIVSGYAELCGKWLGEHATPAPKALADTRAALAVIAEEAFRCKEITGKLLSMSRMGDGARAPVAMSGIVAEMVEMLRGLPRYRNRAIELACATDAETVVVANAAELKQIVLNLVVNALEAVAVRANDSARKDRPNGTVGRVGVTVRRCDGAVELDVADDGCGMSAHVLEHVFEPFFTSRESSADGGEAAARRGVGLGLSISHAIAESHGGSLRAASDGPGRGACFTLSLPAAAPPASPASPAPGPIVAKELSHGS